MMDTSSVSLAADTFPSRGRQGGIKKQDSADGR